MILVEKETNLIKHQAIDYEILDDKIIVNNSNIIFATLNSSNSDKYDVEEIIDFVGNKYLYMNGEVISNPDWTDPEIIIIEEA